jgi:hypothetical protein
LRLVSRPDQDDRIARLRAAAQRKSEDATARAHRAILALETRRQVVNFNTVAAAAAVSKDFLYSNKQLRSLIMQKRLGRPGLVVPAAEQASEASALVKLAVATEALLRIRQENAQLRHENAVLRGELLAARRNSQTPAPRR